MSSRCLASMALISSRCLASLAFSSSRCLASMATKAFCTSWRAFSCLASLALISLQITPRAPVRSVTPVTRVGSNQEGTDDRGEGYATGLPWWTV